MSDPASLDDAILWPVLDRVRRGLITVKLDEYRREWYYEDGRQCLFATLFLERLVELNYLRWDSMVREAGRLRVRQDGLWAVRLDYKGEDLCERLSKRRAEAGSTV